MTCDSIKTFTIHMTQSQIDAAEVASSEIEYLLNNAAGVFDLLQTGLSLGHLDPEEALLHKLGDRRSFPFPGRIYPAGSVTGMPRAV